MAYEELKFQRFLRNVTVSNATGDFEKCNGSYRCVGEHRGRQKYINEKDAIIEHDGKAWKMKLSDGAEHAYSCSAMIGCEPSAGSWASSCCLEPCTVVITDSDPVAFLPVSESVPTMIDALRVLLSDKYGVDLGRPMLQFEEADSFQEDDVVWLSTWQEHYEKCMPSHDLDEIIDQLSPALYQSEGHAAMLRAVLEQNRERLEENLESIDCNEPGQHLLTAQLLNSYTLQRPPIFSQVSRFLNDVEKRVDESNVYKLDAVMLWIKMICIGIQTLPQQLQFRGTGYRGMKYRYNKEQAKKFKKNHHIIWYSLKSLTTNEGLMNSDDFAGCCGPRTLFVVEDVVGKKINMFSAFPDEDEILIVPPARLVVQDTVWRGGLDGPPWETADIITLKLLTQANVF